MNSTYVGMPRYLDILNKARIDEQPVGVHHHLYDKQFKTWLKNNPQAQVKEPVEMSKNKTNATQITAEEATVIKAELQKIRDRLQAIKPAQIAAPATPQTAVAQKQTAVQAIQEKLARIQKQKLADTLKVDTRVDHIKSAGNGL